MTQTNIVMLALAPLIMWRIYKRVQRLTVRQQSRMWRHWIGALLLPPVMAVLAVTLVAKPLALAAIMGGAVAGAVLGLVALRRTGFERVGSDYFYTPHAPIGLTISMLLIGRLLYRAYEFYAFGAQQMPQFGSSPLTLLIFGTAFGYYIAYAIGLLRWRKAERALETKA
jgi:hypothetical protein